MRRIKRSYLMPVTDKLDIAITVNGQARSGVAEPRMLLSDFLRYELGLTGVHVGCEHGVCGACTVLLDGVTVRSCLLFAVQAEGHELTTVEGLAEARQLHPVQDAFRRKHGLQCGFCTPGMILTAVDLLRRQPVQTEQSVREGMSGNLCRCTGYDGIVAAVLDAAEILQEKK
ncbi:MULTISPECIES: (2Fe-2S)-binding protein [Paraburkholderia]|uniref:(2Fe-2S)-binding protein n=1 Tax=Paraburkholderia metrosideri TaxID=580937 RepID=A0ABW9E2V8_9BURK